MYGGIKEKDGNDIKKINNEEVILSNKKKLKSEQKKLLDIFVLMENKIINKIMIKQGKIIVFNEILNGF